MTDHSHHPQAKLKELIERASAAAEINFKKGRQVAPQGFAIRENSSRFAFKPVPGANNAETVSMIRATLAENKVVCLRPHCGRIFRRQTLCSVFRGRRIRHDGWSTRNHHAADGSPRTT
jgi:hypothetical protein